jgi:molybdopterin-guanine dinucleotide biosynthesis protein A
LEKHAGVILGVKQSSRLSQDKECMSIGKTGVAKVKTRGVTKLAFTRYAYLDKNLFQKTKCAR